MLVPDYLQITTQRLPFTTALVCDSTRLTYAQLAAAVNRFARALTHSGVFPGDRVVICLPNSVEMIVGIFGAAAAGAVFVPVSDTANDAKLARILADCSARVLVASARRVATVSVPSLIGAFTADDLTDFQLEAVRNTHHWPAIPPVCGRIDDDLACLIYTSGSTGEPKGVMCRHSNLHFVSGAIIDYLGILESDVTLNVLPLSFSYGLYQALTTFRTGGTLILERSFVFLGRIIERVQSERVTILPAVPTIYSMLARETPECADFSSLRVFTNAAAAISPELVRTIRRRFPNADFYSMYGQTETGRSLYLPPARVDRKPDSVGIPLAGTRAWIQADDGTLASNGTTGELVLQGPHLTAGYWADDRLTAKHFEPGTTPGSRVYRTGDLFRRDSDGDFYFIARKDDIIKSRGEKVAPKAVEDTIAELPGVIDVAVFGCPHPVLGQAVHAAVVRVGNTPSAIEVVAHCRSRLDPAMVPQHVEFCSSLPRTPSGKLRRKELGCLQSLACENASVVAG